MNKKLCIEAADYRVKLERREIIKKKKKKKKDYDNRKYKYDE
jgi:hypothetical protein